jgi:hypothetical protein
MYTFMGILLFFMGSTELHNFPSRGFFYFMIDMLFKTKVYSALFYSAHCHIRDAQPAGDDTASLAAQKM